MNDTVLSLALQTAALLKSACHQPAGIPEGLVTQYFKKLGVNPEDANQVYLHINEQTKLQVHEKKIQPASEVFDTLCREINSLLRYNEKIFLLLLVQDCLMNMHDLPGFSTNLSRIFNCLGVDSSLLERFRKFFESDNPDLVFGPDYLLLAPSNAVSDDMLEGRWIEDNAPRRRETYPALEVEAFNHHVLVMFIDQIKAYVVRCIEETGQFFDQENEMPCRFKLIEPGNEITLKGVPIMTYSGLKCRFLQYHEKKELTLIADHVQYRSAVGTKEISAFVTSESTGQLIGIVGKEGVGKSSLLKLLAGKIKPDKGAIYINGYDLWKNKYLLKGTIGYVPEEDLLYEELTVSDNLMLMARLYYGNRDKVELDARVNSVLSKLDLLELKYVVVGNVFSKHIQPGQRRMINIALELLREPQILLVDNALSGLGMADSSKVIKILHDYSFLGNLVVTTISQADSNTFRLFDKIWLFDEGGRAVYNGNVKSSAGYLHKNLNLAYQEMQDVDPSQLIDLVNYKLPDKEGQVWKRVMSPKDWHDLYLREQALRSDNQPVKSLLPARMLKTPNLEVQLLIFSIRNFRCKFSKGFDIVRTLLTGPIIALLMAYLFRLRVQGDYTLAANENLGLYQYLSVVIALFLGLILSAGEIIRERNMLEKEEYLEFSRFSYLNSKILYLFPVVALQTLLFVLTGNTVLGIREFFWVYWMVLFSAAGFGVLLGLTLSAMSMNTAVVYKRWIPFIMILQLLLGGGIVPFDQLNTGSGKYTPLISDLMVSKWGYEALVVEQYTKNKYQKRLYDTEKKLSTVSFYSEDVVPALGQALILCRKTEDKDSVAYYTNLLQHEMEKISKMADVFPFEFLAELKDIKTNAELFEETNDYLTYLGMQFYDQYQSLENRRNQLLDSLNVSLGANGLAALKANFTNDDLEKKVKNSDGRREYDIIEQEIIRKKDNIFQEPASGLGRARMFAPFKLFNGQKTDTIWFNLSVIWMFSAVCYLLVLFDAGRTIRTLPAGRDH